MPLHLFDYFGDGQKAFNEAKETKRVDGLRALAGDYYGQQDPTLGKIAALGGDAGGMQREQTNMRESQQKELGNMAAILASASPQMRPALWRSIHPKLARYGIEAGPEWDEANYLPTVQAVATQWGDRTRGSELPAEARTALFFQQHPELAQQESERYKNRPFYDQSTSTLVYPRGTPQQQAPAQPQRSMSQQMYAGGMDAPNGPMARGTAMSYVQQAEAANGSPFPVPVRLQMIQQLMTTGRMDVGADGGLPPQDLPAMPPMQRVGPGTVQVGPNAGEKAAQITAAQERAKFDMDRSRAGFDAGQAERVAGATAAGKARAENLVQAQADIGQTLATGNDALKTINEMLTHPGRKAATGLSSKGDPANKIPGSAAYDFNALAAKLKGKAFLQAFASLKGGGQITEVEGQKATDAIAALDTAQSEEQYAKSLRDLGDVVRAGLNRARVKAGRAPAPILPRGAPANQGGWAIQKVD